MESLAARSIAWTEDVHGDYLLTIRFQPGLTTTSSPAWPYMPNITPSSKLVLESAVALLSTALQIPVDSAVTSSNTPRLGE